MTARAASWEVASCGIPVSVVWVGCGGEGPEGMEATAAGIVDDTGVVRRGRERVGMDNAPTGEAEVRSISTSRRVEVAW